MKLLLSKITVFTAFLPRCCLGQCHEALSSWSSVKSVSKLEVQLECDEDWRDAFFAAVEMQKLITHKKWLEFTLSSI